MTEDRRKLHSGHLSVVRCVGDRKHTRRIFMGKPERKDNLEDAGEDGALGLQWILKKHDGRLRSGLIWLRQAITAGLL